MDPRPDMTEGQAKNLLDEVRTMIELLNGLKDGFVMKREFARLESQ